MIQHAGLKVVPYMWVKICVKCQSFYFCYTGMKVMYHTCGLSSESNVNHFISVTKHKHHMTYSPFDQPKTGLKN
jgi:hypothetical protein